MSSTEGTAPKTAATGMLQLKCRNCGSELEGLQTDLIFSCGNCGRCWILKDDLESIPIDIARPGGKDSILMPFWKIDATVSIFQRISRSESTPSIIEGFREFTGRERGLSDSPPETRKVRLIFPAFSTSLVLSTGVRMYRENFLPEKLPAGTSLKLVGGSVGLDDACALARGVAVGVEVNRSDFLACIDLDIEVTSASIYGIGCTFDENVIRINGSDVGIPHSAVRDSREILLSWTD